MAELTIVFRLRFAVALATAVCIFLAFSAAHADATATRGEYIVQMKKGTSPVAGKRLVRRLGGRVTSPTLRVINGFGAALTKKAVRRLRRHRGVKAVTRNRGMQASVTDTSGGYACPTTDATTVAAKSAGVTARPTKFPPVSRRPSKTVHATWSTFRSTGGRFRTR